MGRAQRRQHARLLAALAVFGLVLAPLLHAGAHAREAAQARARARAQVFALGFLGHRTPLQELELREAVEEGFGAGGDEGAPLHLHGGLPGHSHGGGRHGDGALEHLGLALHPPLPPAPPLQPPPPPPAPAPAPALRPAQHSYLVPRFAQGPPAA